MTKEELIILIIIYNNNNNNNNNNSNKNNNYNNNNNNSNNNFRIPKFSPSNISPFPSVFKKNYCNGAETHWQIIIKIVSSS